MDRSLDTAPPAKGSAADLEGLKKKKLWRNLFVLNLCLSIVLIALFWVPAKIAEWEKVAGDTSVVLPQKAEMPGAQPAIEEPPSPKNMRETRYLVVNASSDKEWAYLDFSRGEQVKIIDHTSLEWDLAFRRGKIISNGGATNKFGGGGLIDLGEQDFDKITEVPGDNYTQDVLSHSETENPVLLKWYKYNYLTHKLTAKKNVYAVRTADNKFVKLQFLNFYCPNSEPGCIQLRYVYQDNGSSSFLKEPGTWQPVAAEKTEASES